MIGAMLTLTRGFARLDADLRRGHWESQSGWTKGMLEERAKLIADNIHRAAHGEPPVNLIPASAE